MVCACTRISKQRDDRACGATPSSATHDLISQTVCRPAHAAATHLHVMSPVAAAARRCDAVCGRALRACRGRAESRRECCRGCGVAVVGEGRGGCLRGCTSPLRCASRGQAGRQCAACRIGDRPPGRRSRAAGCGRVDRCAQQQRQAARGCGACASRWPVVAVRSRHACCTAASPCASLQRLLRRQAKRTRPRRAAGSRNTRVPPPAVAVACCGRRMGVGGTIGGRAWHRRPPPVGDGEGRRGLTAAWLRLHPISASRHVCHRRHGSHRPPPSPPASPPLLPGRAPAPLCLPHPRRQPLRP
jgi:hypothetical protein